MRVSTRGWLASSVRARLAFACSRGRYWHAGRRQRRAVGLSTQGGVRLWRGSLIVAVRPLVTTPHTRAASFQSSSVQCMPTGPTGWRLRCTTTSPGPTFRRPGRRCAAFFVTSSSEPPVTIVRRSPCSSSLATTNRCERPFVPFLEPKRCGRLLSEHPRSAGSLHGRPRDDQAWRTQSRARIDCRRLVPRFTDDILPNQCRSGRTTGRSRSGGDTSRTQSECWISILEVGSSRCLSPNADTK